MKNRQQLTKKIIDSISEKGNLLVMSVKDWGMYINNHFIIFLL